MLWFAVPQNNIDLWEWHREGSEGLSIAGIAGIFPGQNISCTYMLSFLCEHTERQVCVDGALFLFVATSWVLNAFFAYTGKPWPFNFPKMPESPQNGEWLPGQTVVPACSYVSHLNVTYLSLDSHFMVALVLPHNKQLDFFLNVILNGIIGEYLCM